MNYPLNIVFFQLIIGSLKYDISNEVIELYRKHCMDDKVSSIKAIRTRFNIGLKEAKDLCDILHLFCLGANERYGKPEDPKHDPFAAMADQISLATYF